MVQFDKAQFDEALKLVTDAKSRGLKNLGLMKIRVELDVLTGGLYPAIEIVTDTGRHHEYVGDDFPQGMDALRKLIAHAYKGGARNG